MKNNCKIYEEREDTRKSRRKKLDKTTDIVSLLLSIILITLSMVIIILTWIMGESIYSGPGIFGFIGLVTAFMIAFIDNWGHRILDEIKSLEKQ